MIHDDAVSIRLKRKQGTFQSIRFNVNGAVSDSGGTRAKVDPCEVSASRTETGWLAELAIDVKRTHVNKRSVSAGPPWLGIARYYPVKTGDRKKPVETRCSTLFPAARMKGHVGHGNHPHLMAFVWGPRIIYESPKP